MPRHWARLLGALLVALVLFRLGYFAYQKAPPYGKVRLWLWTRTHEQLFRPPTGTIEALRAAAREHLDASDRQRFHRATGTTVEDLLAHPSWKTSSPELTARVLGNMKVVAHPLNAIGLHAFRALLAEKITDDVRRARGVTVHPMYAQFMRDGILCIPLNGSRHDLGDLLAADGERVDAILHMVSGYRNIDADTFTPLRAHVHFDRDEQFYMHVDTYIPSWKVFVFAPTKIRQGPFHFVFGSHRNTEGKLRWLHHRSRHLLNETSIKRIGNLKMRAVGPFSEATHGFDGSLRFLGFDPPRGIPSAVTSLIEYGFKPPTPITVADGLMLVVVDTSGLHYRGYARPGVERVAARLEGEGGGCGGCVPRKNPYLCAALVDEC